MVLVELAQEGGMTLQIKLNAIRGHGICDPDDVAKTDERGREEQPIQTPQQGALAQAFLQRIMQENDAQTQEREEG